MSDPADYDFDRLVEIVADVYRCLPEQLIGHSRKHRFTQARHVIASVWAEAYTLADASRRMWWTSPTTTSNARSRIDRLLAEDGLPASRIREVMRRVAQEIPHIVGLYPNQPEPIKMEETPEK
jgi:chromosomal replication initiation ATPase DnaA